MKVRVIRPLFIGGIRKEVGDIVDLPNADEAIGAGRAERIEEQSSKGPMTTRTAPAVVEGTPAEDAGEKPKKPKKAKEDK